MSEIKTGKFCPKCGKETFYCLVKPQYDRDTGKLLRAGVQEYCASGHVDSEAGGYVTHFLVNLRGTEAKTVISMFDNA